MSADNSSSKTYCSLVHLQTHVAGRVYQDCAAIIAQPLISESLELCYRHVILFNLPLVNMKMMCNEVAAMTSKMLDALKVVYVARGAANASH